MKKISKLGMIFLFTSLVTVGCESTPVNNSSSNINNNTSSSSISQTLEHKLTFVENENCTIILSKEIAVRNEQITITVSDITEGYEVHKVTANGYIVDNYSFIMPDMDVEVEVFLRQIVKDDNTGTSVKYNVKPMANEYAVISVDSYYYLPGDLVEINYSCKGSYILDTFFVNGEAIEGTTFTMPEDNVVISGTFINAIASTEWQVSCAGSYMTANSFWYFTYADDGLNIKVIVKDNRICGPEFVMAGRDHVAFSDNVEIIIGKKNDTNGYVTNETVKILVDYAGNSQVRKASSATGWGNAQSYASLIYKATSKIKTLENKDGYNGYEVNIFVAYSMFNLDRESALNNLAACIAMRNSTTFGGNGSGWNCFNSDINIWKNCSKQPVILENNGLQER